MKLLLAAVVLATGLVGASHTMAFDQTQLDKLLREVRCEGCDLTGANLAGANLTGAKLAGANLSGTHLTATNLSGADLSGARLSGAVFCKTTMPDGTVNNSIC